MKELVEVIAKALVDCPDEVVVTETENEKAIVLETGTYCESDSFCCEGCCLKRRKKSDCGDYAVIFAVNRRDHEHGAAGFFSIREE